MSKDPTTVPEKIGDLLQSSGIGSLGVDLFVYTLPHTPVVGTVIIPTGGPHFADRPTRFVNFQVTHRNTHIESALPITKSINALLDNKTNIVSGLPGRVELQSEPGAYVLDENSHFLTFLNYSLVTASQGS